MWLHFQWIRWSIRGPTFVNKQCFLGSVLGYFCDLVLVDFWLRFGVHFGVVSGSFSLRSSTTNVHFSGQFRYILFHCLQLLIKRSLRFARFFLLGTFRFCVKLKLPTPRRPPPGQK